MKVLILLAVQALVVFLAGTLVFDIVHIILHRLMRSNNRLLRILGRLHQPHHRFFNSRLEINYRWQKHNLFQHVILEYSCHIGTSFITLHWFSIYAVLPAMLLQTLIFIVVYLKGGIDPHHKHLSVMKSYTDTPMVDTYYHALHHIYPNQFYSSYIKLFDYLFGTALPLKGKQIAMTGASGALGRELKKYLEKEGATITAFKYGTDYSYDNYTNFIPILEKTDILLLCHGTKYKDTLQANCISYVRLIELYQKYFAKPLHIPEVWATGSEIECHPCFGIKKLYAYADSKRSFARFARAYYHSKNLNYKHLVHAAFTSQMGRGLISARIAAWLTMFLLKRGFKYVPVTYTGFALLNFLKFKFAARQNVTDNLEEVLENIQGS